MGEGALVFLKGGAMDDEKIIELFNQRDERAIAEAKKKYEKYVFMIAFRILEIREDAEECVSDVFLSLWNTIPPQTPLNFKAYVGKIARNVAFSKLDYKKAEKRGANLTVLLSEIEEIVTSDDAIDDELGREAVAKAVNAFLSDQPSKNRRIFVRRYYFCDPVKEIAASFEMSESKVKSLLFRMRKTLGKYLKKEGIVL